MEFLTRKFSATSTGLIVIALFLLGASFWIIGNSRNGGTAGIFTPTARATSGSFAIYVVQTATLDAERSIILSSELPSNQAKILFLAPEGDLVEKGDIVAKFDPAPFEEAILKWENDLKEEQGKLAQSRAELRLLEGDNAEQTGKLTDQIELAQIQLQSLQQSNMPLRVAQAEQEQNRAKIDYERARQERETMQELLNQGLADAKNYQKAKDNENDKLAVFDIKQRNVKSLAEVILPAELRRAQLKVANSKRELAALQQAKVQRLAKQQAIISRAENKISVIQQSLIKAQGDLDNTVIKAPVSGLVLYKAIAIANEKRKAQVGDSLWNRQGFAVIPDMNSLVAYTNVRESDVGKLAAGQSAVIQPQAYPNLKLAGKVESIGTLAAAVDGSLEVRSFRVRIALADIDSRLRPGMTARASILARRYSDVLRVPVEAVFYEDQQPVCFVWRNGSPRRVAVQLGDNDGSYVVVNAGLQEGEQVMLVYPNVYGS